MPNLHTIDATKAHSSHVHEFKLGSNTQPGGRRLTINSVGLKQDGKYWLPAMGEIHYARYPQAEWRTALAQMQAGGLDMVASYVFWIHHEEVEGQFDWSGDRDLRKFVETCKELDFPVIVRCGPWCHGEVRNGGLPDWVQHSGAKLRSTDPKFMDYTRKLYEQIAIQLKGLLWKDGGPVVGIQVDNEFGGAAEYLIALKKLAVECGLDLPIYTRTGWPKTSTPVPFGELMPLFGAYAEGFWDRSLDVMPGHYWQAFTFAPERTDVEVGADQLGKRTSQDDEDAKEYPYLTCELGGGMEQSYHRRILIHPKDVSAGALCKIGSGSNLPGYYMYHGGTNPEGKLTTLNESQETKYYNDVPVKSYDFQAPLGQFGQVRPQYHLLRNIHLLLRDFGSELALMYPHFPKDLPQNKQDIKTLRWTVRSNGDAGFVFINNYQRLQDMPAKPDTQFEIQMAGKKVIFPRSPVTIPANSSMIWPFNLRLADATLLHATAQPLCHLMVDKTHYYYFTQSTGTSAEFVFDSHDVNILKTTGKSETIDGKLVITQLTTGIHETITLTTKEGVRVVVIVLDEEMSLQCWKFAIGKQSHVFFSKANLYQVGKQLIAQTDNTQDITVDIFPPVDSLKINGRQSKVIANVNYSTVTISANQKSLPNITPVLSQHAGELRVIKKGFAKVAESPSDEHFKNAEVWNIAIPHDLDLSCKLLLRITYIGDVARLYCKGKLIVDHFFNGRVFDVSLNRPGGDVLEHGLELRILPLQKDAPIYMAKEVIPDFGTEKSAVGIVKVEWVEMIESAIEL